VLDDAKTASFALAMLRSSKERAKDKKLKPLHFLGACGRRLPTKLALALKFCAARAAAQICASGSETRRRRAPSETYLWTFALLRLWRGGDAFRLRPK
jgi:hypothetical protein